MGSKLLFLHRKIPVVWGRLVRLGLPQLPGWNWTFLPTVLLCPHPPAFCPLSSVLFFLLHVNDQTCPGPGTMSNECLSGQAVSSSQSCYSISRWSGVVRARLRAPWGQGLLSFLFSAASPEPTVVPGTW